MSAIRHVLAGSVAGLVLSLSVVGCQPEKAKDVPGSATVVSSGNHQLSYTASRDGRSYVYDHNNNHLIWSGKLMQGQTISVDPDKNQIVVNGNVVSSKTLAGNANNDIYFDPDPMSASAQVPAQQPQSSNSNAISSPNNAVTVQPGASTVTHSDGSVTVSPELRVTSPSSATTQPSSVTH